MQLTTHWEPYSIVGGTPIIAPEEGPLLGWSVPERFAAINLELAGAEDQVVSRPASVPEARLLGGGAGSPVLEVTRIWRTTAGTPVHVERTVVRADTGMLVYRLPR